MNAHPASVRLLVFAAAVLAVSENTRDSVIEAGVDILPRDTLVPKIVPTMAPICPKIPPPPPEPAFQCPPSALGLSAIGYREVRGDVNTSSIVL